MNHKLRLLAGTVAANLLAFASLGQEVTNRTQAQYDVLSQRMIQARIVLLKHSARASELIGMRVENRQHELLGTVDNLALDVEAGRLVQVIVSSGGFMGIHSTYTAVPPGKLQRETGNKILHMDISREQFAAAPKFELPHWQAGCESNRVAAVYAYFGDQPYFVADRDGYWTGQKNGSFTENSRPRANTVKTGETVPNEIAPRPGDAVDNTTVSLNADGTKTRNYYSNVDRAIGTFSKLGYTQEASKIIGMPVHNRQQEKLGHVKNFIVDLAAGRIAAVLITSKGFMGADTEASAVSPTKLQFSEAHDVLILDATPEELSIGAAYNVSEWPNFVLPGYLRGEYYPYKIEPFDSMDAPNVSGNLIQKAARENQSPTTPDSTKP